MFLKIIFSIFRHRFFTYKIMRVSCFTIASFVTRMRNEPFSFEKISRRACKDIMKSYIKELNGRERDIIFKQNHLGEHYFKRGSAVFMVDIEEQEKAVVLHCILSNDYSTYSFINSFKHLRQKVEQSDGTFLDMRYLNGKISQ